MARAAVAQTPDYVSIFDRNLSEVKPAGLIPSGSWLLRGISMRTDPKTNDKGENYEIVTLTHEPMEAQEGVDPEEVAAVNPVTGKVLYDGRRTRTSFFIHNDNDVVRFRNVLALHGLPIDQDLKGAELAEMFRGTLVYGEVGVRTFKNQGTDGAENVVKDRSWASLDG